MSKKLSGLIIITTALFFSISCDKKPSSPWRTATIERGDIKIEVTATGTINPHALVAVGTQVSGTIQKIFVDFNSNVRAGQLIALLDTTFLHAALQDARATLLKAQTQENLTKRIMERSIELFEKGLVSQADLDQATADYAVASAARTSAMALVDRAKINMAYASIKSPITGIVINRAVDVGQTVAASFNTPTLFSIADDLSKMQVQASIDEADIGQIKTGQKTQFSVDAYPNQTFSGVVTQKRLQPTTVQNVVSYTVMIDVDNPDLILMPGMTANITIEINRVKNVLKVPASALKFVPGSIKEEVTDRGMRAPTSANPGSPKKSRQSAIYLLQNNKPTRVTVSTGLTSGAFTEIEGNVAEGQTVIIGAQTSGRKAAPNQSSPLGGMPRRF